MSKNDHYKKKLEDELAVLEDELESVGRRKTENPTDWEAVPREKDIWKPDEEEVADKIEGYETNTAILNQLETRYSEIKQALKRIDENSFGVCEVGGEEIESERLEANPAATTCMKHMKH